MTATSIGGFLWLFAVSAAPRSDVLLATVPEHLDISTEMVVTANRGCTTKQPALAWSDDGRRVAYAARKGNHWFPVIGNQAGEAWDYVSTPVFAGSHVFFRLARRVTESTERWYVSVDGTMIGPEDWIGDLGVSSSGVRIAYWTQPGAKVGNSVPATNAKYLLAVATETAVGRWSITRGEKWSLCALIAPVFSGSGERLFTSAYGTKGCVALERGKREVALCEPGAMLIDGFAVARAGTGQAFVRVPSSATAVLTSKDATELYFQGKRIAPHHHTITRPVLDASGAHVAYVVVGDGGESVAVDDSRTAIGPYPHVLEIAFDAKGKRLAFIVNAAGTPSQEAPGDIDGGESFVVECAAAGDPAPREHPRFQEVRGLVWDALGEHIAYRARDGSTWQAICGEQHSTPHDHVGPLHVRDHALQFGTRDGRELWWRELPLE